MSTRDNSVWWWMPVAHTWEILNLSSLLFPPHRPPMWPFLNPSTSFPSQDTTKLTGFIPLYCHTFPRNVVIVFCMKESLRAGKTLTSHIFQNWKFCFHLVSLSLSLFHPSLPYFLLCHFVGCLRGWPITLFESHFPIKSRAHQLWRVAGTQQEGIKAMQNGNLRGS